MKDAPFVLVGTVISEHSVPRPANTTSIWESVVVPQAVLRGELADEPVVIPYTGFLGADCSGGPRLREGEQVMIAIDRGIPSYGNGEEAWEMHGTFSKILLKDGIAQLEWTSGSQPLGAAEAVIRDYGSLAGADEEQIAAAIAAANARVTTEAPSAASAQKDAGESSESISPWPFVVGGAVVAALSAAVVGLRRRLSSRATGSR